MKPNLFNFATSELSQDAFLCWLISWAKNENNEDTELQACACELVKFMIDESIKISYQQPIAQIVIKRQWKNIDILIEVNDDIAFIIEDKTNTHEGANQLNRYKEVVTTYYREQNSKRKIGFVFLKTGTYSRNKSLKDPNYIQVNREDILKVLRKYSTNNAIYNDFKEYLERLEEATNAYKELTVSKWDKVAHYQGFYAELQKYLHNSYNWDHVVNAAGGFTGMWGYFKNTKEGLPLYIQIQNGELVFKLGEVYNNQKDIRNRLNKIILDIAKTNNMYEIKRPKRFGSGKTMTLAVVSRDDFLGCGIVDINEIVQKIKKYENIIDLTIAENNKL